MRDVDLLAARNIPERKQLGLKESEAARLAINALEGYHRTHVAALSAHSHMQYPRRHLPFHMFDELDKALFRGVLKGHVRLRWSDLEHRHNVHLHGMTSRAGRLDTRITIELPRGLLHQRGFPKAYILASLIHHMTHAYFLVCCGFRNGDVNNDMHDLGHGLAYSSLLHKIQEVFIPSTYEPFPDLFTCDLKDPRRRTDQCPFRQPPRPGDSCCCWHLKQVPSAKDCRDYLRSISSSESSSGGSGSPHQASNP